MNFKDLYLIIAIAYCARVQKYGNDDAAKNLLWWLNNLGGLGAQISDYPNHNDCALTLSNDLYKAGLENNKVFAYLSSLRNKKRITLYDNEFLSKLPKIVWA